MSNNAEYQSKLVSAADAIAQIPKDAHIWLHHCSMEPQALVRELIEQRERFDRLRVYHMVRSGAVDITTPGYEKYFIDDGIFLGANSRAAYRTGVVDYIPCFFYELPYMFRNGRIPCEALLVQVSPPDEHGFCSLGACVDYTLQAARTAKLVIAQVNAKAPRTLGDSFVHISQFDAIVEHDEPIYTLNPPAIGDEERAIGANCAELIEDGATLQLGIGAIPDAVMLFLDGKKDLGIHSEMISDGTLALYEAGVITGSRKSEDVGKMTVTFLMGTQALFDFVDNNPAVAMKPVDVVNHPMTVARQHKPVSVNSAVEVDLMGQVVAEAVGLNQISGTGGQVDFIRGCTMAEGGRAIIAMPSSTLKKDGTRVSKIVPFIAQGAAVTTLRTDVDSVVTEYGIAELKGKNLRARAKALIAVAHPEFREGLEFECSKRFV